MTFDERINSLYINRNIRIEPEMEVDIKVENNEIKISPVLSKFKTASKKGKIKDVVTRLY